MRTGRLFPKIAVSPFVLAALSVILVLVFGSKVSILAMSSGGVLILSLWIMQKSVGLFHFRTPSLAAFWYFVYLSTIFIPAHFVFAEQVEPYRTRFIFAVDSVMLTVPLGMMAVNGILSLRREEILWYFRKPAGSDMRGPAAMVSCLLLAAVVVTLSLLHLSEVQGVPLFYLLTHPGGYFEFTSLRENAFKLLGSPLTYFYGLTRQTLFPFIIIVAFGRYLRSRQRKWLLFFAFVLVAGILYGAMTIEKSPVALIMLALFLYYFIYSSGRVGKKFFVLAPALFVAFPLFIYFVQGSGLGGGITGALEDVGRRLFYEPARVLYYYFEVFPAVVPYQYGATIGRLRWLTGAPDPHEANIVGLYMDPSYPSVHANAAFIGNLNVDFGLWGVILGGLLAGVIMQSYQAYLSRRPKDSLNLAVYAFVMLKFATLSHSPLPVVLLSEGVLLVPFLVKGMRIMEGTLRKIAGGRVSARRLRQRWAQRNRSRLPDIARG